MSCSRASTTITEREPLVFDAGPAQVRRLAIVSGAGADYLAEAAAAGADALLTGEPAERAMAQARESGLHFIAAGHYATETFGIRRLGEHLAERFGLRAGLSRRSQPRVSVTPIGGVQRRNRVGRRSAMARRPRKPKARVSV